MNKVVAKIRHLYYCFLTLLSPELNTKARFKAKYGFDIDLKNPKRYNEKGMWLKLNNYNNNPTVKRCADKYAVRPYIEEQGCGEILNDLITVYDSVSEIEWDKLPNEFVMKWNFGCGYNLICNDKSKMDIAAAEKKLRKWGRKKYHLHFSEMQYKGVPKKLIVEKYLKPANGLQPEDYKFFCFNGKAEYVMVCLGRETGNTAFYFFDKNWNLLRLNERSKNAPEDFTVPKPEGMDEMFAYADKLSAPFPFVRVDFYNIDGKTVFGEMTFTPAGFLDTGYTEEAEFILGEKIDLNFNNHT